MSPINIKIIFAINLVGLMFSFLARRFINKQAIRMIVPTIFLYLSTIATMYMIINSRSGEKSKSTTSETLQPELPKVIDIVESKVFIRELYQNKNIDIRFNFNNTGITIDHAYLNKFNGVNPIGDNSAISIQLIDQNNKVVEWDQYSNRTLSNNNIDLKLERTNNKYLTNLKLMITNHAEEPMNFKVRLTLNPDENSKLQAYHSNKVVYLSDSKSINKPQWFGYTLNNYWANYILSEFDSVSVITKDKDKKYVLAEKSINIGAGKSIDVTTNLLNAPTKITVLREYKDAIKSNPGLIIESGGGIFGLIRKLVLVPCLLLFETSSRVLGHPLLGMIILILSIKLVMIYNSYRSHSFGTEIQKIMKLAGTGGSPDAVKHALTNSNLNIQAKVISVVVKLFFFMVFYKIFQTSPLFYGSRFLWVKDLSAADHLHLNNLFGFFPLGNYLPTIGLLPLFLGVSFFIETLVKNKANPKTENPNDQKLSMIIVAVILTLLFSRMQAVLCVYMIINNSIDNAQNYIFDRLMSYNRRK